MNSNLILIVYFALTLLSVLIQFTVMELIQENIEHVKEKPKILNLTSHKRKLEDVLEDLNKKPHALYYRINGSTIKGKPISSSTVNPFLSKSLFETTTDVSTTVVDELYDENTSIIVTTDMTYSTTEFDNFTEISFFGKKNETITKPNMQPKRRISKACSCNFLYGACDINCCCDNDCSNDDLKLFNYCDKSNRSVILVEDEYTCHMRASNMNWHYGNKVIDNLFCIIKNNLPEKRNINREKYDTAAVDKSFKWHSDVKQHKYTKEFKRHSYSYGDHVWVLKNGTIRYIDLPSPVLNNYCTGRKPLQFMKNEKVTCIVKLKDLEMFQILKASDNATLISVLGITSNSSNLDCSALHCTNWTIMTCDGATCETYNKTTQEPSCTDTHCTNIALKFDYIFYYHDSKIINATIKLYTQKISITVPFLVQEINVEFIIKNSSIDNVVKISGNPGYISGLPVIVSYANGSHTDNFFNNSSSIKYIKYPSNNNGLCTLSNATNDFVTFQTNKRLKCRFQYIANIEASNESDICKSIHNNIIMFLGLDDKVVVCPFGNPQDIKDEEWLLLQSDMQDTDPVYGEYNERHTKLHCFNIVIGKSYIFTYADTGEKGQIMKILGAKIEPQRRNLTFNVDDISTVLTIDTTFIDETNPRVYEYATGPYLNIHLPKDFFFPFHHNKSICNYVSFITMYCCLFINYQIK